MTEQETNEVSLPEDSCQQFDIIVEFMYTTPMEPAVLKKSLTDDTLVRNLIELYLTGDKYGIVKLQDCIIDYLADGYEHRFVEPYDLVLVLERMGSQSQLSKLLGDVLRSDMRRSAHAYDPAHIDHRSESERDEARRRERAMKKAISNEEVEMDVLRILALGGETSDEYWIEVWKENPCRYHLHTGDETCWVQRQLRGVYFQRFRYDDYY